MKVIKPKRLQKGDKVAIVSPSYAEAKTMPDRLQQSFTFLRSLGLEPMLMPHALEQDKDLPYLSAAPKDRAGDINQAFADSSIKAIFCTVGGENCNALLPLLDYELIKKNPKVFMGFSDITVLLLAIYQKTGLVTFHGPNLLYTLGVTKNLPADTSKYLENLLFHVQRVVYRPVKQYDDISLSSDDEVLVSIDLPKSNSSWRFLREGEVIGRLIGGNLKSIQHLRGTNYWPDFAGTILFWEELDESVSTIHQWLTNLRLSGVFNNLQCMIVSKIADKPDDWNQQVFEKMLLAATQGYSFPILTEVDLGHTRPMLTLPIGIEAMINLDGTIKLLESATL